jgi:hypothetical protein
LVRVSEIKIERDTLGFDEYLHLIKSIEVKSNGFLILADFSRSE